MALMDQLLVQAEQAGSSQEHMLEQAHYASLNVEEVMGKKFDDLIALVQADWGTPEQNIQVNRADGKKVPLPKWLHDSMNVAGSNKLLNVAYWRRGEGYCYVMLRVELDSKDRPNYYDLLIGSRRRIASSVKVDKLRKERPWWAFLFPGRY